MMPVFPTQYSTLSAVALNSALQESYGLPGTTCRLLIRNVSDTYLLESAANKYIFKIYRDFHRKRDEIKAEVELLNILKSAGVKVSYPLTDKSGHQLQEFNAAEGIRYGVLFSFAKGEPVYDLSSEHLKTLGHEMAHFHNISSKTKLQYPRPEFTVDTMLLQPVKVVAPAFKNLPDEYALLKELSAKVADKIKSFDTSKFSYGYCHYDFLPKNFHFENAHTLTFFDFDFCGWGMLANDIASFYVHYFMETTLNKITKERGEADFQLFIDAYREVRPFTEEELEAVPYLGFAFWVFYLRFQFENYDDWSNSFFNDRFLRERIRILKLWADRHLIFKAKVGRFD
ncbi:phosphotransferase [Mucilaginibacter sp. UR6-1]|uniref:phosphotransferase enzyme family protein n=1 Tax=Mucilaginibacter sp. UR6-1 TaxID=1435643 RepID=UPI001E58D967|nr:phosphotransferase [Mucilaginibacter sp. UR6-1]MCC8411072.1 phosphotransferase [Mucilaginibacter sp. UR6-1]